MVARKTRDGNKEIFLKKIMRNVGGRRRIAGVSLLLRGREGRFSEGDGRGGGGRIDISAVAAAALRGDLEGENGRVMKKKKKCIYIKNSTVVGRKTTAKRNPFSVFFFCRSTLSFWHGRFFFFFIISLYVYTRTRQRHNPFFL